MVHGPNRRNTAAVVAGIFRTIDSSHGYSLHMFLENCSEAPACPSPGLAVSGHLHSSDCNRWSIASDRFGHQFSLSLLEWTLVRYSHEVNNFEMLEHAGTVLFFQFLALNRSPSKVTCFCKNIAFPSLSWSSKQEFCLFPLREKNWRSDLAHCPSIACFRAHMNHHQPPTVIKHNHHEPFLIGSDSYQPSWAISIFVKHH